MTCDLTCDLIWTAGREAMIDGQLKWRYWSCGGRWHRVGDGCRSGWLGCGGDGGAGGGGRCIRPRIGPSVVKHRGRVGGGGRGRGGGREGGGGGGGGEVGGGGGGGGGTWRHEPLLEDKRLQLNALIPACGGHVTSRQVKAGQGTSRHVRSRQAKARHVTSRHVTARQVKPRHVESDHATPSHVTSRQVEPRHVKSSQVKSVK